jgi:polyhydroxyalkanoate synthesis regulator phasin
MNKKMAALGLTVGLTAGGAAGLIVAAPALSGAQSTDTTVAESTDSTATETEAPESGTRLADALAPLVEDGTLTQEQADKVVETLKAAGPFGGHGGGRGMLGKGLDVAATALGMTEDDLRTALRDGQTIAQVAESKGIDVQVVIDALIADATTRIDEKVAAGDLTQEEADARLAELTERITERVNNTMPARGEGGGRHGGAASDESTTEDSTTDESAGETS